MSVHYHYGEFPPRNLDWEVLTTPLACASDALARYDSFLSIIPNSEVLVSPLMVQEAVSSSKIEGTRATANDVLMYEAGDENFNPAMHDDIREVVNYRIAVNAAKKLMDEIPLSGRVIKFAHSLLLKNVRVRFKSPGMYRKEPNWIGTRESKIENARFVPIHPDKLEDAMATWEEFVNESTIHPLLKISIAHAEFESIHPFLDGNGRIGRMIIPLMLCSNGILTYPSFYLSEFFEHRDEEYQDRLLAVSRDNDWTGWCNFFLSAIETQARKNTRKANQIFQLREQVISDLFNKTKSANVSVVVNALFEKPIFSSSDITHTEGINPKTARRLLDVLKGLGYIIEIKRPSGRRAAIYYFPKLFEITEGQYTL
ncbi:MAG: Fic/DOC family N-terminal domain-containing protein [Atopobium sp.]|uniref:Fic family protein n=1 Tax=Atopobium sp. TaxID=1872650 RepID=UPI002A83869E|nr:Fic/DOC family N-terminal domain-containing protein [Atopobium sp.]MDY4522914.1 Fic/DOC family N-terminal domain-containing protein [Atopobium sp.]